MQFIPRLSSTSINNKHHHETRASLGGWRQHRPACSTSDQIPFQRCLYTELRNRFPQGLFGLLGPPGTTFPHAFLHISKLRFYRLWHRPTPPQWLQRWQRAPVAQDKRQTFSPNIPLQLSDMPPCFPSAGQSDWHLPQHWWHDLVSGVGHEGSRKEKKALVLAQWRAVSREKSFLAVSLWSCFMSPQGAKANFSALLKRHY